ncbi:MAG: hypothetical protein N3A66_05100, partial [Planctomycetota bacterium]|nr:hypothetical protein [Planctomycetota bacterium]
ILLIYPSLALLAAAFLQMAEEKKSPGAWAKRFFWFAALAVFVASGLLLFLAAAKPSAALSGSLAKRLAILDAIGAPWRQYGWRAAWALAILAVAMAKCARQRPALAAGFLAAAVATGFALFIALVPFLNRHKSDRGLCQRLAPLLEPGDRVFNYATPGVPTLTYYLRREVERLEKPLQVMAAIDGAGARRVWFLIDDDDWRDLAGIAVVRAAADGNESREALEARLAAARAVLQRDKRCQIMGEGCSPWPEGLRGLPARPGRVLSARWLLVAVANKGDANTRSGLSIAEERRILAASLADLEVWWQPLAWHLPPLPGQRLRGQPFWTPGLALPLEDFQASDRFRDLEGDAR